MRRPDPIDLRKLEFFDQLSDTEVAVLAADAFLVDLDTGETLFMEGEPLDQGLRFVLFGGLRMYKTAASGKQTVLRLIYTGDLFGVAALFDKKLAPATAAATQPTRILVIRLAELVGFLAKNPEMALRLLVTFSARLRDAQDALHSVVSQRARTRLARVIRQVLAREGGQEVPGGIRLKTRLPHSTLSRLVGITYEECVRLIREWTQEPAVLSYGRGGVITLLDIEQLSVMAEDQS